MLKLTYGRPWIPVAIPALLIGLALGGCGGSSSDPAAAVAAAGDAPFDSAPAVSTPNPDVQITKCGPVAEEMYARFSALITNSAEIAQHYHVTVWAYDSSGARTEDKAFLADYSVAPGEAVKDSSAFSGFAPGEAFTCKIANVRTIPADQAEDGSVWWL